MKRNEMKCNKQCRMTNEGIKWKLDINVEYW